MLLSLLSLASSALSASAHEAYVCPGDVRPVGACRFALEDGRGLVYGSGMSALSVSQCNAVEGLKGANGVYVADWSGSPNAGRRVVLPGMREVAAIGEHAALFAGDMDVAASASALLPPAAAFFELRCDAALEADRCDSKPLRSSVERPTHRAAKEAVVAGVTAQFFSENVVELTGNTTITYQGEERRITTRFTGTEEFFLAEQYYADMMADWGYDVYIQYFEASLGLSSNVVARKRGSTSNSVVVVGGHYDSRATTNQESRQLAPGAEDNGSGSLGVLNLAKAFADVNVENTIEFVLFGAEEQGLYGSRHYVDDALDTGKDVLFALTADMISYLPPQATETGVNIVGYPCFDSFNDIIQREFEQYAGLDFSRVTYRSYGSDQIPFNNAGLGSIALVDQWIDYGYSHYHRVTDTWEKQDPATAEAINKGWAAAAAELAGAF